MSDKHIQHTHSTVYTVQYTLCDEMSAVVYISGEQGQNRTDRKRKGETLTTRVKFGQCRARA